MVDNLDEEHAAEAIASRSPRVDTFYPTTLADITFSTQSDHKTIYKTLFTLRKSTLSIPNRLNSVLQDAEFVEALFHHLRKHCPLPGSSYNTATSSKANSNIRVWPLIPNERSGSWALDPFLKATSQVDLIAETPRTSTQPVSAYFKSTDGHISQWSFSSRRLNLPVLNILGHSTGAVIIDTTRRGKVYPDALRRTVPIWCTVWNRVLFPELIDSGVCDFHSHNLDASEVAQINARIPGFIRDLKALNLDLEELRQRLKYPIRCVYISQPSHPAHWASTFEDLIKQITTERQRWANITTINILICCSASKQVLGAEMSEEGYIQGAGDDSEGWSQGLTSSIFWQNKEALMAAVSNDGEEALDELVRKLVTDSKSTGRGNEVMLVKPTRNLFLAGNGMQSSYDLIIDCNGTATAIENEGDAGAARSTQVLALACKEGKSGSKTLRDKLPEVKVSVERLLKKSPDARILARCSTGNNLSPGVALVILCCLYNDEGGVDLAGGRSIDKQFIKQRLAWITSSKPDANPSRATLQAVNSFLIDRPG